MNKIKPALEFNYIKTYSNAKEIFSDAGVCLPADELAAFINEYSEYINNAIDMGYKIVAYNIEPDEALQVKAYLNACEALYIYYPLSDKVDLILDLV